VGRGFCCRYRESWKLEALMAEKMWREVVGGINTWGLTQLWNIDE